MKNSLCEFLGPLIQCCSFFVFQRNKVLVGALLCRPFLKNPNKFIRKENNVKAVVS